MPSGMRRCVKMVSQPPSSLTRIRGQTRHGSNSISQFPIRFVTSIRSSPGSRAWRKFHDPATGDLDCDGVFSTFERMGNLNADGEVEGASGIFINQN